MLPFALLAKATPFGAIDCMVVRVVVRDRTEGAGDEKVLSPPRRDSTPPWAVRLVPARDDAPWDRAVMDREPSRSADLAPAVGGGRSSTEELKETARSWDMVLDLLVLRAVENECRLLCAPALVPMRPESGYGLLFLECPFLGVVWLRFAFPTRLPSFEDVALRLASFLMKVEKGRRRPTRSGISLTSVNGLSGRGGLRVPRNLAVN